MRTAFLGLYLFMATICCYADQIPDILLIPTEDGAISFMHENQTIPNYDALLELLKSKGDPLTERKVEDHQLNKILGSISLGIGGGFFVIWMINEVANVNFSSPNQSEQIWKYIVIGASLLGLGIGTLFDKAAGSDIMKAIDLFNKAD